MFGFSLLALLAFALPVQAQTPNKIVAYVNAAQECVAGDGWGELQAAQGRFALPVTLPASQVGAKASGACSDGAELKDCIGETVGTAMKLEDTIHQLNGHTLKYHISVAVSERKSVNNWLGNERKGLVPNGTHTDKSTTHPPAGLTGANAPVASQQCPVCEYETAGTAVDVTSTGAVSFFNATSCPEHWAHFDEGDGRFVMQFQNEENVGDATKASRSVDGNLAYATMSGRKHDLSASMSLDSKKLTWGKNSLCTSAPGSYTATENPTTSPPPIRSSPSSRCSPARSSRAIATASDPPAHSFGPDRVLRPKLMPDRLAAGGRGAAFLRRRPG